MSIRHFTPKRKYRQGISDRKRNLLIFLLIISMVSQISTVLLTGSYRIAASFLSGAFLALFSIFHAQFSFGTKYASLYFLITFSFSLFIEALNSATGWPFGGIIFGKELGLNLFNVPIFVILGWLMMVHPILVLARQISKHWIFFFGGLGLAAWDLLLDSVLVKFGYWEWKPFNKSLPLVSEIPLSNTLGWLLSGMSLIAILNLVLPKERRKSGIDFKLVVVLLGWIWVSSMFSNLFIFHNYGVAIIGGLGLGILLIPFIYKSLLGDV